MERTRRGKTSAPLSGSVNVLSGARSGAQERSRAPARYEIVPHEAAIVTRAGSPIARSTSNSPRIS
jgi:hypothetical protein